MRYTPAGINTPEHTPNTPKTSSGMLAAALALARDGWAVFPLRVGTKVPLLPGAHKKGDPPCHGECGRDGHGAWDGTSDPDQIRRWWASNPMSGIGANLGDDRIAFDIDVNHGGSRLDEFPDTRVHHTGRGGGNAHLIYRIEPGSLAGQIRSGTNILGAGLDIRSGRGSYIVMPPTKHEETNLPYTVGDEHGQLEHLLTDQEVQVLYDAAGVVLKGASKGVTKGLRLVQGGKAPRVVGKVIRTLAQLLGDPPGEGGRNDWLTRVAGHLAKQNRDKEDLFLILVAQANNTLSTPLGDAEVSKITNSIWDTEVAGHPERDADEGRGWLSGTGRKLFCQVATKEGEETVWGLAPYGDFDLTALGVFTDESDRRKFWVQLNWGGQEIRTTVESASLVDERLLRGWLAAFGASIDPPLNAYPKTAAGVRILRYLNAQNPTQVRIIPTLGWDQGVQGFVTHEGMITEGGLQTKEDSGVVADPSLLQRGWAPFTYGFQDDLPVAQSVLREVLTFQDSRTASVFGAWWAACLLRPQIQAKSSLFPFFGVEASSESGKTNGFFELMVGLNGNTMGQTNPTRPVLRDYASANRNGIVWADDLNNLDVYGEYLRASTSNGTAAKMDIDRSGIVSTQIVAPILITGEALGMSGQKALADRSIVINAPSPKDRMSLHDPDRLQWDDIVEIKSRYPKSEGGLSVLAGHLVQAALGMQGEALDALVQAKRQGTGRHGDKMAVLRAGARLLDALVGQDEPWEGMGEHAQEVERWISSQAADLLGQDNTLTREILPWALRTWGMPQDVGEEPEGFRFKGIGTPAYIVHVEGGGTLDDPADEDQVWVRISVLADAWARDRNHRVDPRTETTKALQDQIDAIPGTITKVRRIPGTRTTARYRKLPSEYARVVLERARE
jgi:hypothetical protein